MCVGVEVPQSVGRFREVLPAHQATVLHRSAAAAARTASQRVRALPRDEGPSLTTCPLLYPTPGIKTLQNIQSLPLIDIF